MNKVVMKKMSNKRVLNTQVQPIEAFPVLFWLMRKPSINPLIAHLHDGFNVRAFCTLNNSIIYSN